MESEAVRRSAVGCIVWLDPNVLHIVANLQNLRVALPNDNVKAAASESTRRRSALYGPLTGGQASHIRSLISNCFLAIDREQHCLSDGDGSLLVGHEAAGAIEQVGIVLARRGN